MLDIISTKILEEKEFLGITEVAARRLKNPADRSEFILIRDLIAHHFKDSVVAESDQKSEMHIQKVEDLSQSQEFRQGFLSFQRSVKAAQHARPFPCIVIGRSR